MTQTNALARSYTDDEKRTIVETICAKVAEGGVHNSFRAAAAELGLSRATLYKWIAADKDLQAMWTEARIWQAHSTAEDAIELADGATKETAHAVRLQVDTRKWYTSKIAPKIYGDRLELAGPNGIPLMPAPTTRTDLSRLTMDQLEQYAALMAIVTVVVEPLPIESAREAIEDRADVRAARNALADPSPRIPWPEAMSDLVLRSAEEAKTDGR